MTHNPKIRFTKDDGTDYPDWRADMRLGNYIQEVSCKNRELKYIEVWSVSNKHGFIKQSEQFDNREVASKDISNYKIIYKNMYAYNPSRINVGSIARSHSNSIGVVSPMYITFTTNESLNVEYFDQYISTFSFQENVRNNTSGSVRDSLNFKALSSFQIPLPCLEEQEQIADYLSTIDEQITLQQQKCDALSLYKKSMLQQIFSQTKRFTPHTGGNYPDWRAVALSKVLTERKEKSTGIEEVHSVSVHKGIVNQIEHLGRSFAATDTSKYNLVKSFDIIYTKSPTGDFPLGIIKYNQLNYDVIVSPLYGIFIPKNQYLGYLIHLYFESKITVYNYLNPLVQKGAKNTLAITNDRFLTGILNLPTDPEEQEQIADYFTGLDEQITLQQQKCDALSLYKKSMLQQMMGSSI